MLERSLAAVVSGSAVEQRADAVGEPTEHRIRERDRALEAGTPDQLHGLVDRRVARDAVDESELVRAETERGSNRRVEAVDAPSAELLDRVVERSCALHRAVGQPLRERAITVVEAAGRRRSARSAYASSSNTRTSTSIRRRARRAYGRSPRSHAS